MERFRRRGNQWMYRKCRICCRVHASSPSCRPEEKDRFSEIKEEQEEHSVRRCTKRRSEAHFSAPGPLQLRKAKQNNKASWRDATENRENDSGIPQLSCWTHGNRPNLPPIATSGIRREALKTKLPDEIASGLVYTHVQVLPETQTSS